MGFDSRFDFGRTIGWELDHVTIDKFHLMFWFVQGDAKCLLNVADRMSYIFSDGRNPYRYEIYGDNQCLNVGRILRERVEAVAVVSASELRLTFSNGDAIVVHDNPGFRSWWILRYAPDGKTVTWSIEDDDPM